MQPFLVRKNRILTLEDPTAPLDRQIEIISYCWYFKVCSLFWLPKKYMFIIENLETLAGSMELPKTFWKSKCWSLSHVWLFATPWTVAPASSVHGVLQGRTLEWTAIPFSGGSSWPRDRTWVSCIAGRFFTIWATREAKLKTFYLKIIVVFNVFAYELFYFY